MKFTVQKEIMMKTSLSGVKTINPDTVLIEARVLDYF